MAAISWASRYDAVSEHCTTGLMMVASTLYLGISWVAVKELTSNHHSMDI